MHSWHVIDLKPLDFNKKNLSDSIPTAQSFGVIHFLTPECSCSEHIFKHLLKRGPINSDGVVETAVIINDNELNFAKKLKSKGFITNSFSSSSINEKFKNSIKGVPLLVIYDSNKISRYVGGYVSKSITPFTEINILPFLKELKEGRTIASKPVIGCAVSKEYQQILDPFGIKYKGSKNE